MFTRQLRVWNPKIGTISSARWSSLSKLCKQELTSSMTHKQREWRDNNRDKWLEYMRQWRIKNRDKVISSREKWEVKNSERRLKLARTWRRNNPDKKREQDRRHRAIHAETISETAKQWRLENPEKIKSITQRSRKKNRKQRAEYNKQWRARNIEKSRNYHSTWKAVRNLESPHYRTLCRLRARIHKKLKTRKKANTLDLCGTTIGTIMNHLESQFRDGMTWENQGYKGWHIDHIQPCSSFDLTDSKHQKKCFHYTNLQPLWWWENLNKSNKI